MKRTVGAGAALGAMSLGLRASAAAPTDTPPNILFVLTDDQRWDAVGYRGQRRIQTPMLDELARGGVVFNNAFVTTSICCTSRASIFTGMYARRHGIHDFHTFFSEEHWRAGYPMQLRAAGYHTGFVGKFGVGHSRPAPEGDFDFYRPNPYPGRYFDPQDLRSRHATDVLGDGAVEFLRNAPRDRPFCLSVSFGAPHAVDYDRYPYQSTYRNMSLYDGMEVERAGLATEAAYEALPPFLREGEARRRFFGRFEHPALYQRSVRDYYRTITDVDDNIRRMYDTLHETGRLANTVIIFTSDNGYFLGDRGLADKWFMYENSIRVPMLIWDPRRPESQRGHTVDSMALNIDLAPTMLELAGLDAPAQVQGRSLVPFTRGESPAWRDDWFYEHLFEHPGIPQSEGVREERWKYVRWIGQDPVYEQLFDLRSDPHELNNLAGREAWSPQLARLRERWDDLRTGLK